MDKVLILGLKADSVIGVHDWEREIRQQLVLDLVLFTPMDAASASDALADALDYAQISKRVITEVEKASYQLLEALGAHLLGMIMDEFDVQGVRLKILKPGAVPEADTDGVEMTRGSVD